MSRINLLRRVSIVGGAAATAVVLGAGAASAHHCYIPMNTLNGPQSSAWEVYTAQDGAAMFAGFEPECDEATQAGYDALRAAGMPVAIKIKANMTIGDPKDEGRMNPNGANGKGLEYFGAGSTLADEMIGAWVAAASAYDCGA